MKHLGRAEPPPLQVRMGGPSLPFHSYVTLGKSLLLSDVDMASENGVPILSLFATPGYLKVLPLWITMRVLVIKKL